MPRSKSLIVLPVMLGLFLATSSVVLAQSATSGAIAGSVVAEEDGSALPGAQITAVHEPTGIRATGLTRGDGRFAIPNLRVGGPYAVTASFDGFRNRVATGIYVKLGETTSLSFRLQLDSIAETVLVVSESSPLINSGRTGAASSVTTEALESLPTISRGFEDFARSNPFFTISSGNQDPDNISIAGRNARYNNIAIDGSVNNDLFGLADTGTPGGQAGTTSISLDAVQELQLVLAPFDVRQGGFSSGGINAVTRSGSNRFKGSAFFFTRDDSLVGDGPDQLGAFGDFEQDQYGFRIGGPIVRDRIFFFANLDLEESVTPTGFSLDGSSGQQFGFTDSSGVFRDVLGEANRFRDLLIDRYGFDPGGLSQSSNVVPSDKIFARLDFNLSDRHNLTLRHNFVDGENGINRPSNFTYEWPSETYAFRSETNSTVAQLNSTLGSHAFNELRVARQTVRDQRDAQGGVRFPWIEIENVGSPSSGVEFEAGTEPFSTANSLDQDLIEVHNDLTWLKGNHTLTFGTHNEFFSFENLFIQNFFGAYEFATLDAFEAGIARRYRHTFPNPGQDPLARFDVEQIGLYVGDQWAARPNLTLTFGLRLDVPFFSDQPGRNPRTEELYGLRTDVIPDGNELWSPRFGFNWDVGGAGKSQLRGGAGIFAGRTPYVWISNQFSRNALVFTDLQAFGVPFNPDPDSQPRDLGGGSTQEVNLIDPDFEFPQVLRVNLAYDRQLPWWGLVGSVEAVISDSLEEVDYQNVNLERTGALQFDGRPLYRTVASDFTGAYLIGNTDRGEATNLAIKLERPFRDGISGFVSYAYGDSETVNDGTSSRAVSNWQFTEAVDPNDTRAATSEFEVEHRFNASVSYRFNRQKPYPTTVAAFYNLQSGRPYSTRFTGGFPSINGDGFTSNDLFYVPAGPDDVLITNGTWDQLDAYIRSDAGLDAHRGQIVPRGASQAPWNHTLDLHVAQEIPIKGTSLQVTFDLLNLMNLIDEDSGVLRFANFNSLAPAVFGGVDPATGKPIYTLTSTAFNPDTKFQIHNVRSRWKMKLGLRWSF
ncbi:MAG: TonB-dependent receptor [Acidobacteriota bacterium]